jgi:hypothetical protein
MDTGSGLLTDNPFRSVCICAPPAARGDPVRYLARPPPPRPVHDLEGSPGCTLKSLSSVEGAYNAILVTEARRSERQARALVAEGQPRPLVLHTQYAVAA